MPATTRARKDTVEIHHLAMSGENRVLMLAVVICRVCWSIKLVQLFVLTRTTQHHIPEDDFILLNVVFQLVFIYFKYHHTSCCSAADASLHVSAERFPSYMFLAKDFCQGSSSKHLFISLPLLLIPPPTSSKSWEPN
jgi:hypothetical protein